MDDVMQNQKPDEIFCEDCAFYNRSIRSGCSAPQNLKKKTYPNRVTKRTTDVYIQKWKDPEIMRIFGWLSSRLFGVCGKEARWFSTASAAEVEARKPIQLRRLS